MTPLAADRGEIGRFVAALFRYADEGGFISLRIFEQERGKPPVEIRAVQINGEGLAPVIAQATGAANRAARHAKPLVFAPPVCTFASATRAAESDVLNGVALMAEADMHPERTRERLCGILGPPTVVNASGGTWTDPETGEVQDKLHVYWRLAEPTRTAEEHAKLKRARRLMVALTGSDPSAVPLVHPLRWPGSWHRKGQPRLCRGAELNEAVEVSLDEALDRLEQAAMLAVEHADEGAARLLRVALDEKGQRSTSRPNDLDPDARDPDLDALADAIPNDDVPRAEYIAVGLGFYAASGGSAEGFNAWDRWARKSAKYHGGTRPQWEHFHDSPPDRTGKGALVERARRIDSAFRLPSWGPEERQGNDRRMESDEASKFASFASFAGTSDHQNHEEPWPAPLAEPAYHGLAGEIVRAIEPETEADPAALLFQLLTAVGNIIGCGSFVRVEGDRHTPRLFTVQVGKTSKGRKGTSWGRVREPLELAARDWLESRVVSGLSSGEGLIHEVRDEIRRVEVDKNSGETSEVIADPGVKDKRLLVVEGEFAKALRTMERQGNILSAVLRDAWDRGDLRTLVKSSPTRATGAHVSIIGHITADELRRYLDRTEAANGLANRFIFVCVQRSKLLPRGGRRIDWSSFDERLRHALAAAGGMGEVQRTEAGWRVWEAVYAKLSEDRPGLLGAILARAEAQVLRLALIYALLDKQAFIDAPHMLAALACWDYAEASARHIFGQMLGDPVADEILRALRAVPQGMTRTELMHHFNRHLSSAELSRGLAVLARDNLIVAAVEQTKGRPAERWRVRA